MNELHVYDVNGDGHWMTPEQINRPGPCATVQEYYDLIVAALESGRLPGRSFLGSCQYRFIEVVGEEKKVRNCIAGLLLHDDDTVIEGAMCSSNAWNRSIFERRVPGGMSINDLHGLQRLHDKHTTSHCGFIKEGFLHELNEYPPFWNNPNVKLKVYSAGVLKNAA